MLILLLAARVVAADLVVHEWGTFTAVTASNGVLLSGLELEEHALPPFVLSHAGFAPLNKGWSRPVRGVTIKMETPVLYFYAERPVAVGVEVGFRGGSISQWYPQRNGGERLPPLPADLRTLRPIDFAAGYNGSATWRIDVLPRDTALPFSAPSSPHRAHWERARVASANRVRGAEGEVEGFIFYRGLGNFPLPLEVRAGADDEIVLRNHGDEPIAAAFVYERLPGHRGASRLAGTSLEAGETRSVLRTQLRPLPIERGLGAALIAAGLTGEEAAALLATWRESYFDRPGLRVFWLVPRAFTDAVLPIAITPAPAKLERVLVGRTEVLTPRFEAMLRREFAANGGKRWATDRYFRAYRERAQQLGATVGIAAATAAP